MGSLGSRGRRTHGGMPNGGLEFPESDKPMPAAKCMLLLLFTLIHFDCFLSVNIASFSFF